jgi:hypothetical protein
MVVSYFLVNPHVLLNDSLAPSTVRAQRAHKRLLACVRAKVLPQTAKRRMGREQLHMMEAHVRDATQIKKKYEQWSQYADSECRQCKVNGDHHSESE